MIHRLVACFLVVFGVILVGCNIYGDQNKPITLSIMPTLLSCSQYQRVMVRVLIRVEPHQDNRYLHFAYTSDVGESGSSLIELNGMESPLSYTKYVQVNCAYYLFTACVLRTQGKRFCDKQEARPP